MTAPGEGSAPKVTAPTDSAEAQSGRNDSAAANVVGKPERWQLHTLGILQQRVREAQADLLAAVRSFAPQPGCSLVNGEWVSDAK